MDSSIRRISAYMTVEASLLVPMMVVVMIFVIYWTFYIYNNCVVYQDCYISSLRGSQMMDMNNEQIKKKVYSYAETLLDNQLFQYQKNPIVDVGMLSVKVSASTNIDNKLVGFMEQKQKIFAISRDGESRRIDPVWLIRNQY